MRIKLGQGRWQVFEMERLLQNPTIAGTVVDYLFHRIQRKLSSEFNLAVEELKKQGYSEKDAQANAKIPPTMIVLDECWAFFESCRIFKPYHQLLFVHYGNLMLLLLWQHKI